MAQVKAPRKPVSHVPPATRVLGVSTLVEHLGQAELRRRFWHIFPGLLAYILCVVPHEDPMSVTCQAILLVIAGTLATLVLYRYANIARCGEKQDQASAGVIGYAFTVLGTLLLFPGQSELGMTVLAVLAFGDGFATLGGLLIQGPSLPWNPKKTWSGTGCFVVCGSIMAALMYWGQSQPTASVSASIACATSATFVAAIAESLPLRINDNIRVGVAASVTVVAVHGMLVGWA